VPVEWDVSGSGMPEAADAEPATTEELPGAQSRLRWPRAVWLVVALACAAGLVAAVVTTHHPRSQRPSAAPSVTSAAATSAAVTEDEAAIVRIRDLALTPRPLSVYVRATTDGYCVPAKPGLSPQQRISTAVDRIVAGSYRVTDVGFVVEPNDGLCALQLRARDSEQDVLVVDVVAPPTRSADATSGHLVFGSHADPQRTIEYASGVLAGGWHVTVGAVGPASQLPTIEHLVELVENPATRW